jgi:hypothetical protein
MASPHLPPEIWTEIAYFACTDGGKTAASLLRVSKSISEGALIHAYTTVALTGRRSVQLFLNRVINLTSTQRARIRDLYICQPPVKSYVSRDTNAEGNRSIFSNPDTPMSLLFEPLLPLLSPTLRSLALITFSNRGYSTEDSPMRALNITPLNALRHLTFHAMSYQSMPRFTLPLPAVTHLHASWRNYTHIKLALNAVTYLAEPMPHLSHLTLYGLVPTAQTRAALQVILGDDDGRDQWKLRAQVESVRISLRTPIQTPEDEDPVLDFQTDLESAVGQYRALEFLGAEYRVPDTPEGWLAFWLGQVIDLPDGDAQTNTADAD